MVCVLVNNNNEELQDLEKICEKNPNISKIHLFRRWDRAAIFIQRNTVDILVLDMATSGIYHLLLSDKLSDTKIFVLVIASDSRLLEEINQKEYLYFLEKPICIDKINQFILGFSDKYKSYEIFKS